MKKIIFITSLIIVFLASSITLAAEKTKVQFWHAMGGDLGPPLEVLVEEFNETHPNIQIEYSWQGHYEIQLTKILAALLCSFIVVASLGCSGEKGGPEESNLREGVFVPSSDIKWGVGGPVGDTESINDGEERK